MVVDVTAESRGQFNPIEAARRLKAAGRDPDVAEAVAGEFVLALGDLVTKEDFRIGIEAQDARFEARLNALAVRMMIFQVALTGALFAALRFTGTN